MNNTRIELSDLAGKTILIDTCTIWKDSFPEFVEEAKAYNNALEDGEAKIGLTVIAANYIEAAKLISHHDEATASLALERLKYLNDCFKDGSVKLLRDLGDSFADNELLRIALEQRTHGEIYVVTQDVSLCKDLQALNDSHAVKAHTIRVLKLSSRACELVDFTITPEQPRDTASATEDSSETVARLFVKLLNMISENEQAGQ